MKNGLITDHNDSQEIFDFFVETNEQTSTDEEDRYREVCLAHAGCHLKSNFVILLNVDLSIPNLFLLAEITEDFLAVFHELFERFLPIDLFSSALSILYSGSFFRFCF